MGIRSDAPRHDIILISFYDSLEFLLSLHYKVWISPPKCHGRFKTKIRKRNDAIFMGCLKLYSCTCTHKKRKKVEGKTCNIKYNHTCNNSSKRILKNLNQLFSPSCPQILMQRNITQRKHELTMRLFNTYTHTQRRKTVESKTCNIKYNHTCNNSSKHILKNLNQRFFPILPINIDAKEHYTMQTWLTIR